MRHFPTACLKKKRTKAFSGVYFISLSRKVIHGTQKVNLVPNGALVEDMQVTLDCNTSN